MDDFKHALVWGQSAKHNPQIVGAHHVLMDEDVLQVPTKCTPLTSCGPFGTKNSHYLNRLK